MKILVTGASGYIGGSVATYLAKRGFDVSGLVRKEESMAALRELGVKPVLGDLHHIEGTRQLLLPFDAIINCADSDNSVFVTLALETLEGTGKVFIHTSGSSIVSDRGTGDLSTSIFDEANYQFRPEKAARVGIDRMVQDAANRGIRSAVICPTMIYGKGLGPKMQSIQIPLLIAAAKKFGAGVHVGAGKNVWSNVHIADLVKLYEQVLAAAPAGEFYFAENGEQSFADISARIHNTLGFTGTVKSLKVDEAIDLWGAEGTLFALASNSRVSAKKARALGWTPKNKNLLQEIG